MVRNRQRMSNAFHVSSKHQLAKQIRAFKSIELLFSTGRPTSLLFTSVFSHLSAGNYFFCYVMKPNSHARKLSKEDIAASSIWCLCMPRQHSLIKALLETLHVFSLSRRLREKLRLLSLFRAPCLLFNQSSTRRH